MSQQTSSSSTKKSAFKRSSRAFFAVLTLCILAVGGVAASTLSERFAEVEIPAESPTAPTAPTPTMSTTASTSASPVAVTPATTQTTVTTASTAPNDAQESSSLFILPLSNQVLTPYSEAPVYSQTLCEYRTHKAVDFEGDELQAVRACANGTVTDISVDPIWGATITLEHTNGITTVYRGVDATVIKGAEVKVGDTVGNLATVPCESAMAPHLHIEMYQNGKAIDFTTVVSGQLNPVK